MRVSVFKLLLLAVIAPGGSQVAAQLPGETSWEALREMDVEQLEHMQEHLQTARYQLTLALKLVDNDVERAVNHVELALSAATPGSDEARLSGMIQCSFQELLGESFDPSHCADQGKSLEGIKHPLPATLGYISYGIWLAVNGRYSESLRANLTAEKLALAAEDWSLAATIQNNIGVDCLVRGLPLQALKKFQAALEHVRTSGEADNKALLTLLTSNIASTHLELGEYDSANKLLQTLISEEGYDRNNPTNLFNEVILARASLQLNRPQEGFDRLNQVLAAIGPSGVTGTQALAHSVLGDLLIALGRVEDGLESFARARDYGRRSGDPLRVSRIDTAFAEALVGLGRMDEASVIIETSIKAMESREPSMILAQALDLRSDVLAATDQRNAVNAARREARQMRLKVMGEEHDLELAMLSRSLELANTANELADARENAQRTEDQARRDISLRNQLILTALLLTLIGYLVLSRRYERQVAKTVMSANAVLEVKVTERTSALEREMAERLQAESARQTLAQNLAESEKLQALGQLTSGVAHDFNNLMTIVTLSADQLRNVTEIANSSSLQDVDNILSAAESASDITASLLAYVRKQPLTPQPTNLDEFLEESLTLFQSTLGTNIKIRLVTKPCSILVDQGQLTTAVINLLLNAKETLNNQGTVSLEVDEVLKVDEQGETSQWATLAVRDYGEGMTPTQLRRATEPFFTTKAIGHGTGLGLSMVDGFVKQSGGHLQIDSTRGEGTIVTLLIPQCVRSTDVERMARLSANELPSDGCVVIVDDQKPIRDVLSRLLEQMGIQTQSAKSGAEALALLKQSRRADLLITDLMMPGDVNGQQLVAEVRKLYPDMPILTMSGYTNSIELDVEFLHKPFSLDDLRQAIDRAINAKQAA